MTVRPVCPPARRRRFRAAVAGCTTLLVVLLAPLAAGSGHDAAPTPAELVRLDGALDEGAAATFAGSEVARQYFRAAAGGEPMPADDARRTERLARARLFQLPVVAAMAGLVYLVVLLARGRVQALLACAALATLPPIAVEGSLLRPEVPAALFALLALLLLQSFAQTVVRRAAGARGRRLGSLFGLGLCAALALGLSASTLPSLGVVALLPGLVVTLGAAMLFVRTLPLLRRRGLERLPCRALNARLLPWTALALAAPAVVILVLALGVAGPTDAVPGTLAQVSLLPQPAPWRWLVYGLLAAGAVAAVLRIGLRFGRGGQIGAEVVLLVYCALELAASVGAAPQVDRLPAAPALAIVLAEGGRVLLTGIAWLAAGWPRAR